jgi:hypothetical protein
MQRETRTDRFVEIEDRFAAYEVYDPTGSKIGKVDDLFVDEGDQPEYLGVKMGLLGTKSTLIPWELVEVREGEGRIIAALDKDRVKDGPAFDDDQEITPSSRTKSTPTTASSRPAPPRIAAPTPTTLRGRPASRPVRAWLWVTPTPASSASTPRQGGCLRRGRRGPRRRGRAQGAEE